MCWYNHSLCLMFIVRVMCPKEFLLNIISTCLNDWCAFWGDNSHYLKMLFYHKVEIVQVILTRNHNFKNPKMDGHIPLGKKYLTITAGLILIYLDTKHHWMRQINKNYIYIVGCYMVACFSRPTCKIILLTSDLFYGDMKHNYARIPDECHHATLTTCR